MPNAADTLINVWKNYKFDSSPYVLPEDFEIIDRLKLLNGGRNATSLHFKLWPKPYQGDLLKAKIYFLMINPSYSSDEFELEKNNDWMDLRRSALNQIYHDYPFHPFTPDFTNKNNPSFRYWHPRLKWLIQAYADNKGLDLAIARQAVSKLFCVIDLIPYISEHPPELLLQKKNQLISTQLAIQFVHEYLLPRAKADDAMIFAIRRADIWRVEEGQNIYTKDSKPPMFVSQSAKFLTSAHPTVLSFLGINVMPLRED